MAMPKPPNEEKGKSPANLPDYILEKLDTLLDVLKNTIRTVQRARDGVAANEDSSANAVFYVSGSFLRQLIFCGTMIFSSANSFMLRTEPEANPEYRIYAEPSVCPRDQFSADFVDGITIARVPTPPSVTWRKGKRPQAVYIKYRQLAALIAQLPPQPISGKSFVWILHIIAPGSPTYRIPDFDNYDCKYLLDTLTARIGGDHPLRLDVCHSVHVTDDLPPGTYLALAPLDELGQHPSFSYLSSLFMDMSVRQIQHCPIPAEQEHQEFQQEPDSAQGIPPHETGIFGVSIRRQVDSP